MNRTIVMTRLRTSPIKRRLRPARSRRPNHSQSRATSSSTSGAASPAVAEPRHRRLQQRGMPVKSSVPSRKRATATSSAAMSAADARGPWRPASRAMRSAGNRLSSGARKSSRPMAARSGAAAGDGWRRRVRQGVLDRESHVGGTQLGLEGAVAEADGGVDDALRVDDDLDGVVADIVQPVCLDDLQALVRERRGIDGDLGAHAPGRVPEGLRRGDRRQRLRARSRGMARPTR